MCKTRVYSVVLAYLVASSTAFVAPSDAQGQNGQVGTRAYLLSLSFAIPTLSEWSDTTIRAAAATPYDGFAARLVTRYSTGPAPHSTDFAPAIALLNKSGYGRAIWPWVFLNRIIAPLPNSRGDTTRNHFPGVDLDGTAGALQAFYDTWRTALKVAKDLGAPGIVLDPEPYSNYGVHDLAYLAELRGISVQTASSQARKIGAALADITAQVYPGAVILSLFTQYDLPSPESRLTPTIFDGLLQEAQSKNIDLVLVAGGESYGYCALNLQHLQTKQERRLRRLQPALQKFPGLLVVGATIAPWANARERTRWYLSRPECKATYLKTISDFEPLFVWLIRNYRYVWIYGAWKAAPYRPLDKADQKKYDPVLRSAKQKATSLGPLPPPQTQ